MLTQAAQYVTMLHHILWDGGSGGLRAIKRGRKDDERRHSVRVQTMSVGYGGGESRGLSLVELREAEKVGCWQFSEDRHFQGSRAGACGALKTLVDADRGSLS